MLQFGADAVMDAESEKIMQEASAVAEQQSVDKISYYTRADLRAFYVSDFRCSVIGSKLQLQRNLIQFVQIVDL